MDSILIGAERPDSADAMELIAELEAYLEPQYPAESRHGFSVDKLLREQVAFFVARQGGTAAGCGGVKLFGTDYGEVKRMYVRPAFRGRRLGTLILDQLANHARAHGVNILRLETGIYQTEAIALYTRWGFAPIPPFGAYREDPLSLFYEKRLG
ncbi:MAG: GNAT family N-acetyltransferase [Caldilineaceae bacterium]|nr:GNAT family N-acetyltransferase [Caldilineaceae bacterium]